MPSTAGGVYADGSASKGRAAMTWIKPAFDEIKMDAEAKSYSDGLTW